MSNLWRIQVLTKSWPIANLQIHNIKYQQITLPLILLQHHPTLLCLQHHQHSFIFLALMNKLSGILVSLSMTTFNKTNSSKPTGWWPQQKIPILIHRTSLIWNFYPVTLTTSSNCILLSSKKPTLYRSSFVPWQVLALITQCFCPPSQPKKCLQWIHFWNTNFNPKRSSCLTTPLLPCTLSYTLVLYMFCSAWGILCSPWSSPAFIPTIQKQHPQDTILWSSKTPPCICYRTALIQIQWKSYQQ